MLERKRERGTKHAFLRQLGMRSIPSLLDPMGSNEQRERIYGEGVRIIGMGHQDGPVG